MEREQIIGVLRQPKAEAECIRSGTRDRRVRATIYTWKSKYGWMGVYEAQRLKSLEDENRRLKHPVADLSLDK
jgi:putative transposase